MGRLSVKSSTQNTMIAVSVVCFGGAFGGFINALAEPVFEFFRIAGTNGFATHLHDPDADGAVAYASHRVVWGAIWGLMFLIPMHRKVANFWLRSLIFALIPTLFALLISIPAMTPHAGLFGIGLGIFTPLFVLISYWITWAVPAYLWVGLCGFGGNVDDDLETADASDLSPQNLLPS